METTGNRRYSGGCRSIADDYKHNRRISLTISHYIPLLSRTPLPALLKSLHDVGCQHTLRLRPTLSRPFLQSSTCRINMAWWGIDDLHGYMKDAVLPELKYGLDTAFPPSGHKSHRNTLSTRFRKERHLTSIQCLDDTFDDLVNNCQPRHDVLNM